MLQPGGVHNAPRLRGAALPAPASLLETQEPGLPPWAFASPFAGLSPHQFRWNTLPGTNVAAPTMPAYLPLGSLYGSDKIAPPSGSGSGSGAGSAGSGSPKYVYYDPYHPPPHLPYGYQPYAPYNPMYHPLPPAGLLPPTLPNPALHPSFTYGNRR